MSNCVNKYIEMYRMSNCVNKYIEMYRNVQKCVLIMCKKYIEMYGRVIQLTCSPLYHATVDENVKIVTYLADNGADV
jgi:hypothetical protein